MSAQKQPISEDLARALRDCAHGRFGLMRTELKGGAFGRLPMEVRAAVKTLLGGIAGENKVAADCRKTIQNHLAD